MSQPDRTLYRNLLHKAEWIVPVVVTGAITVMALVGLAQHLF